MLYLFKHLFRLSLFLTVLALLMELPTPLKEGWTEGPKAAFDKMFQAALLFGSRLVALEFSQMTMGQWVYRLYHEKVYYILLLLISAIVYYNIRNAKLKMPPPVQTAQMSPEHYKAKKEQDTKAAVKDLQESPAYKMYKRDKLLGRLKRMDDDETAAEMREKEEEIFS